MTRLLPLVSALILALAPLARAGEGPAPAAASQAAAARVAWDEPAHKLFFNYQRYLAAKGLFAETEDSWKALKPEEQQKKLAQAEAFLKAKLAAVMAAEWLSPDDQELIKAVWGDAGLAGVRRVAAARATGDPAQIQQAVAQASALIKKLGGINPDWRGVFDGGAGAGAAPEAVAEPPLVHDFLQADAKPGFLDSLSSKETQQVLATQRSYAKFLVDHGVSEAALPGMLAMYQVLSQAKGPEKAELAHILPTVVTFLNDGKGIYYDPKGDEGAYGYAISGDYDRPEMVKVTPAVVGADPVVVGKTLAHEFQHIYDMYAGRYGTLDTEMRGFKVAVLYFKALKKESPEKYKSLVESDNDDTRSVMRDVESYTRDYDESPQKFREAVSVRYQQRDEGSFEGRMSLRETVDPRLESGAVVDLATERSRLAVDRKEVADLEARERDILAKFAKSPSSRDLGKELEKVTRDLAEARSLRDRREKSANVKMIRLQRMQSEARWMDKKAAAAGQAPPPYDLTLPVDRGYVTP